ncbi:MAG: DUF349 domain-containing protein [Gammaproteobacteria bacterium]
METSKDLFKELEIAEKLFLDGSIKIAQKKVRNVINKSRDFKQIPNKLRHKLNAAINKSKYFDDISAFATNPKRDELIAMVSALIEKPLDDPKKHAHAIHDIQGQWQLLDVSSKSASKSQWLKFNELTNKAWESCKEYFEEMKTIKINNATERERIINEVNRYVIEGHYKKLSIKDLLRYLRQTFEQWQTYAPVLEKDLNRLRKLFTDAKKPINQEIVKQEQINKEKKESLITQVNEIKDEDNQVCINKFKDLKNIWVKIGPAGKKNDNKLWSKFNKAADKFFVEKKQSIKDEIELVNKLKNDLDSGVKSINETEDELTKFKNIRNTKELTDIRNLIKTKKSIHLKKQNEEKLSRYINIYNILLKKDSLDNVQNVFKDSISESLSNKKSNLNELVYSCIKLEILAKLDSLKKYQDLRNSIQLELLQNKFKKASGTKSNDLDSIICHFIVNFSSADEGAEHKKLWNRMTKCFEVLI